MKTWAFFFSSKSKQILQEGEFGGEDKDKDLLFSSSPNNIARGREKESLGRGQAHTDHSKFFKTKQHYKMERG
jgi:hypothetical protein